MITLTTDFGEEFYVAQMKGVILSLKGDEKIADITHELKKYGILDGAFVLSQIWRYFPKGTIHLCVVDPGVGASRRDIIIETDYCYFVGPDNGVFSLALDGQIVKRIIEIDTKKFGSVSKTFHGRDVFAPVAARLSGEEDAEKFGKKIRNIKKIEIKKDRIIYIDLFGNIITTVSGDFEAGEAVVIHYKNRKILTKFGETFSDVPKGRFIVLKGSHGFLEIDVNQGNAAVKLGASAGDLIKILRSNNAH